MRHRRRAQLGEIRTDETREQSRIHSQETWTFKVKQEVAQTQTRLGETEQLRNTEQQQRDTEGSY